MLKVWILTLTFMGYEGKFDTAQYTFQNQHDCLKAREYVLKHNLGTGLDVNGFCLQTDFIK